MRAARLTHLEVLEGAAFVAVVAEVDGALRLRGRLVD